MSVALGWESNDKILVLALNLVCFEHVTYTLGITEFIHKITQTWSSQSLCLILKLYNIMTFIVSKLPQRDRFPMSSSTVNKKGYVIQYCGQTLTKCAKSGVFKQMWWKNWLEIWAEIQVKVSQESFLSTKHQYYMLQLKLWKTVRNLTIQPRQLSLLTLEHKGKALNNNFTPNTCSTHPPTLYLCVRERQYFCGMLEPRVWSRRYCLLNSTFNRFILSTWENYLPT